MSRKTAAVVAAAVVILSIAAMAAFAQQDDIKQHASCKYCGMDRQKFDATRMLIEYEDGTSTGVCSLHCTAVELALNIDKTPKALKVADMGTKSLIDAEKASWVGGGSKAGVMTKRSKWAFEKKEDAEAFVKTNGGTLTSFDDTIKAAYTDMYEDTKMIREKRKMMKGHCTGWWDGRWWWIPLTALGGLVVALLRQTSKISRDVPGAIALAHQAWVDPSVAFYWVAISAVSLILGASLGPSFGPVVMGGGFGSWLVTRLEKGYEEEDASTRLYADRHGRRPGRRL